MLVGTVPVFAQHGVPPSWPKGMFNTTKNGRPMTVIYDDTDSEHEAGVLFEDLDDEDKLQVMQAQGQYIATLQGNLASQKQEKDDAHRAHAQEVQGLQKILTALRQKPVVSGWEKNKDLCYGSSLGVSLIAIYLLTDHIHGKKLAARGYKALGETCSRGKALAGRACGAVRTHVVKGKDVVARVCAHGVLRSKELSVRAYAVLVNSLLRGKNFAKKACVAVGQTCAQGYAKSKEVGKRVCVVTRDRFVRGTELIVRMYAAALEKMKAIIYRRNAGVASSSVIPS